MSKIDSEGGQAFPDEFNTGMSIRDYFAGQALSGLIASGAFDRIKARLEASSRGNDAPFVGEKHNHGIDGSGRMGVCETIAALAYGYADVMLVEKDMAE